MRLIPGTKATVKLDGNEHHFVLIAAKGERTGRAGSWLHAPVGKWLNVAAPLAILLGSMAVGDVVKAWTPPRVAEAEAMRVELVEVTLGVDAEVARDSPSASGRHWRRQNEGHAIYST